MRQVFVTRNPIVHTHFLDLSPATRDRVTYILSAFEAALPRLFKRMLRNVKIDFENDHRFYARLRMMCVQEGKDVRDFSDAVAYFDYEYETIRISSTVAENSSMSWLVSKLAHELAHAYIWMNLTFGQRQEMVAFLNSEYYDSMLDPEEDLAEAIGRLAMRKLWAYAHSGRKK
jgi:hypothetical protein